MVSLLSHNNYSTLIGLSRDLPSVKEHYVLSFDTWLFSLLRVSLEKTQREKHMSQVTESRRRIDECQLISKCTQTQITKRPC